MEKNKILIFVGEDSLKESSGGPGGYNCFLKRGMGSETHYSINYLPSSTNNKSTSNKKKKNITVRPILSIIKACFFPKKFRPAVDFVNFDGIHFHSAIDIYRYRYFLKEYKGKVILTTHAPVFESEEILSNISLGWKILFFPFLHLFKKATIYGIKKCHYYIVPCKEAIESYVKVYKHMYETIENKTFYLITGCSEPKTESIKRDEVRNLHHIPLDKFVCTYIGRHNKVKGYDVLTRTGIRLNSINNNVFFAIGGATNKKIPAPKTSNWLEMGFVNDAFDIMFSSDLFVSANTDTYFDLSIIMALAAGKLIVSRNNGGNKYIKANYNVPGFWLFEKNEDLYKLIDEISKIPLDERAKLGLQNRDTFREFFNEKEFANNYLKILDKIFI